MMQLCNLVLTSLYDANASDTGAFKNVGRGFSSRTIEVLSIRLGSSRPTT